MGIQFHNQLNSPEESDHRFVFRCSLEEGNGFYIVTE